MLFFVLILSLLNHNCHCTDLELTEYDDNCHDYVDISDENGTSHYDNYLMKSVKFYFLTEDNDTIPLNSTNLNLVNTSQPTKFLIHGLGAYDEHVWVDKMANVYHTNGDYNIIAVDWSVISEKNYDYVVTAVDAVGNILGTFIMQLTETNLEYLTDIHLIGSSMGAQVGGAAGETIKSNGTKIGRITGLAPTNPQNLEVLDEDDAEFVDVIHTSVEYGHGKTGKADFYIVNTNDGRPICYNRTNNSTNTDNSTIDDEDSCAQLLANEYYISSIEDRSKFLGVSCEVGSDDVVQFCDKAKSTTMGEHASRNASGNYLVKDAGHGLSAQVTLILVCVVPLVLFSVVST